MRYLSRVGVILLFNFIVLSTPSEGNSQLPAWIHFEGVYEIERNCTSENLGNHHCKSEESIDRLVVLNTETPKGIIARFFSKVKTSTGSSRWQSYLFSNLSIHSESDFTLTGLSDWDVIGFQDKIELKIDPLSDFVKGQLVDTRNPGNINFTAKRIISSKEFFREDAPEIEPSTDGSIPGQYQLEFNDIKVQTLSIAKSVAEFENLTGSLILKKFENSQFRASFLSKASLPYIEFNTGVSSLIRNRRLISLTSYLGEEDFIKWQIVEEIQALGKWKGIGISSKNGNFYRFTMSRTGNVRAVPNLLRYLFY